MRRLDPKSILILSVEWLRKAVYPLLIALFANSGLIGRQGVERTAVVFSLLIPVLVGALLIVGGIVSYFVTRFGIVDGALIIVKKGLWRQERTIPLERIQNVQITRGLLERLLGVATLKVETASGSGIEANLKSLSVADAELVKQELLRSGVASASTVAPELPTVYRAEFKDIALAGALQNRALIVMAAIMGLFGQGLDDLAVATVKNIEKTHVADEAGRNPVLFSVVVALGGLIFLLVGWVLSILYAVFVYYGFKVVRTERGLQVSYGLVSTVQTVIPLKRIQSLQTRASWLFKALGLNQLYVQSIGGHAASGEGHHVASGQTLLAPICRPIVLRSLIRLIKPNLDIDSVTFLASDKFYVVRRVTSLTVLTAAIGAVPVIVVSGSSRAALALPLVVAATALYAIGIVLILLAYRRQGYALTEDAFLVCHGALGQNVTIVPVANVQAVSLESSWFLRRRGLVDLHVMTPVSSAVVPCLPVGTAESLKETVMGQSFGHRRYGL